MLLLCNRGQAGQPGTRQVRRFFGDRSQAAGRLARESLRQPDPGHRQRDPDRVYAGRELRVERDEVLQQDLAEIQKEADRRALGAARKSASQKGK